MARHGYDDDDFDIVDADGWNLYYSYALRRAPQQPSIHMTQQMTTEVAPAYDGQTSFFAFEDAIDDWCDITELEPEKRGPALRNRLEGEAQQYKRLLDREMLRDPNDGVNYFKRFLRPHFIKGAQDVFLNRFMQLMKFKTGTMDLQKWMTRFQLTGNRLTESWMDLLPELLITSTEAILYVAQRRQKHEDRQAELAGLAAAMPGGEPHVNIPWTDEHALEKQDENRCFGPGQAAGEHRADYAATCQSFARRKRPANRVEILLQKAQAGTNINDLSLFASKLGCAWHYFNSSPPDTRCIPDFHYRF